MGDFQRCIELILAEEGGLANHRRDPGGLTDNGTSQRSYPDLNIVALTKETAEAIYRRDYWNPVHDDDFPGGLDLLLLDGTVNQGPVIAIRCCRKRPVLPWMGTLAPSPAPAPPAPSPAKSRPAPTPAPSLWKSGPPS